MEREEGLFHVRRLDVVLHVHGHHPATGPDRGPRQEVPDVRTDLGDV